MPVHLFYDEEGNWSPWTLRAREGSDTLSWEEYFWYAVTPGGWYTTGSSSPEDSAENVDYFATKVLMSVGGFAIAGNAILAAEAYGGSAIAAELALYRAMTAMSVGAPIALATLGSTSQHNMVVEHGTGIRGSPGSVAPSSHLDEGDPYWESMTLAHLLPWNWG